MKKTAKHTSMSTTQLLLLCLQISLSTGIPAGTIPPPIAPAIAPILTTETSPPHPFNTTPANPPDPLDVLWAQTNYLTTFHSYTSPTLPLSSLRAFVDGAISALTDLRTANHDALDDPVPGGVFRYETADLFSELGIGFQLASDSPGVSALSYYEVGGVIASLAPYMRKWRSGAPASAVLELWMGEGAVSVQKAAGYISGFRERLSDE